MPRKGSSVRPPSVGRSTSAASQPVSPTHTSSVPSTQVLTPQPPHGRSRREFSPRALHRSRLSSGSCQSHVNVPLTHSRLQLRPSVAGSPLKVTSPHPPHALVTSPSQMTSFSPLQVNTPRPQRPQESPGSQESPEQRALEGHRSRSQPPHAFRGESSQNTPPRPSHDHSPHVPQLMPSSAPSGRSSSPHPAHALRRDEQDSARPAVAHSKTPTPHGPSHESPGPASTPFQTSSTQEPQSFRGRSSTQIAVFSPSHCTWPHVPHDRSVIRSPSMMSGSHPPHGFPFRHDRSEPRHSTALVPAHSQVPPSPHGPPTSCSRRPQPPHALNRSEQTTTSSEHVQTPSPHWVVQGIPGELAASASNSQS